MNISAPFIARPVATTLLTIGIALAGFFAYLQLPVSPLPQVDFPTISVQAQLPGASPETMATSVADAAGAPSGQIADVTEMTSHELGRQRAHHAAVRPGPRHRRRGARRAGGDQRRARRPADQPAQQPDLPQGQSGRRAGPDPGADLRDADARARCTTPRRNVLQQKLSQIHGIGQVDHRRRRAARGARGARTRTRCSNTASGWRTCAPRWPRPTPTARRASIEDGDHALSALHQRPGQPRRATTSRWSSPTATARAVRLSDVGRGVRIRSRTSATPASPTASRRCW